MSHILEIVYSWPFFVAFMLGLGGMRLYCYVSARRMDRVKGGHHGVPGLSRIWIAGLVTAATIGYVLLTAQRAQDRATTVAHDQASCGEEFRNSLKARSDIAAQDTELSNKVSDIRSTLDEALGTFLDRRLNPPPEIAALDANDPRRLQWRDDITLVFADWQRKLRTQVADLTAERRALLIERAKHPLPDIKC